MTSLMSFCVRPSKNVMSFDAHFGMPALQTIQQTTPPNHIIVDTFFLLSVEDKYLA